MKLQTGLAVVALALCSVAPGQTKPTLPCDYRGELLRNRSGRVTLFTSDEMKARARHKRDISGMIREADIKGTAIVDVLVAPDGHVVCTKSLSGPPIISASVQRALRKWEFNPAEMNAKRVAYVGRMEFALCNMLCGESGPSMSIIE